MTIAPKHLLPLLLLTACGPAAAPTIETTQFNPSLGVNLAASTKEANGEYYRTLTAGSGAAVADG